jgi:hypothetical protein
VGVFNLKDKEKYHAKIRNRTAPTDIGPEACKRRQSTEATETAPETPSSARPVKPSRRPKLPLGAPVLVHFGPTSKRCLGATSTPFMDGHK